MQKSVHVIMTDDCIQDTWSWHNSESMSEGNDTIHVCFKYLFMLWSALHPTSRHVHDWIDTCMLWIGNSVQDIWHKWKSTSEENDAMYCRYLSMLWSNA